MTKIGVTMCAVFCLLILGGTVGNSAEEDLTELRVCSDPSNLPFSNKQLEGFENKIAALIGEALGIPATHYWWPAQRGLVRSFLNTGRCDVLIGVPTGYDLVTWTKPYYRTAYVIAYKTRDGLTITSLDDPVLKNLKIGVHVNTPPHDALARRGIIGSSVVAYSLIYDSQYHPEDYPGRAMEDLLAGKIDVAIVWGPIAGYFARKQPAQLTLVPLQGIEARIPFTFKISMGVRKGEKALKARLEEALDQKQTEIHQILEDYGVPLLPIAG